jgi:hypothetical protein
MAGMLSILSADNQGKSLSSEVSNHDRRPDGSRQGHASVFVRLRKYSRAEIWTLRQFLGWCGASNSVLRQNQRRCVLSSVNQSRRSLRSRRLECLGSGIQHLWFCYRSTLSEGRVDLNVAAPRHGDPGIGISRRDQPRVPQRQPFLVAVGSPGGNVPSKPTHCCESFYCLSLAKPWRARSATARARVVEPFSDSGLANRIPRPAA